MEFVQNEHITTKAMNELSDSMSLISVGDTSMRSELVSPRDFNKMTVEQCRNFKPLQMNENTTRLNGYLQSSVAYWDEVDDSLQIAGLN